MSNKTRGLYQRFYVERLDGKDKPKEKHDGCYYFCLDMTPGHDPFAMIALKAYADACRKEYPFLAEDLNKIINRKE